MATSTNTSISTLSCDDSPLSVTGNIFGILTFAYGLLLGFIWFLSALRSNLNDVSLLIQNAHGELNRFRRQMRDLFNRHAQHGEDVIAYRKALYDRLAELNECALQCEPLLLEMREHAGSWKHFYLLPKRLKLNLDVKPRLELQYMRVREAWNHLDDALESAQAKNERGIHRPEGGQDVNSDTLNEIRAAQKQQADMLEGILRELTSIKSKERRRSSSF